MNEAAEVFRARIDALLPVLREAWKGMEHHSLIGDAMFHQSLMNGYLIDVTTIGWPFEPNAVKYIPPLATSPAQMASVAVRNLCSLIVASFIDRLPEPQPIPPVFYLSRDDGLRSPTDGENSQHIHRCLPVAFALSIIEREGDDLAADAAAHMQSTIADAVPDEPMRCALWGRRRSLAKQWPWPMHTLPGLCITLLILKFWQEGLPQMVIEEQSILCPADWNSSSGSGPQAAAALRLLTWAIRDIEAARHRPMVAVDAGKPHHTLLMNLRDLPKDRRERTKTRKLECGRIEIIRPGPVQLTLPLDLDDGLHAATIKALRNKEVGGWYGLRTWAALLRLLSVEGGRGPVVWTMDRHIEALGYEPSYGRRLDVREKVERTINALAALELAVYDTSGGLRERAPLVVVYSRRERQTRGRWRLEEARIGVNPLLYSGVRRIASNGEPGRLGCNWGPAPVELAKVDHKRHPYALSLGLLLPIRWHLALAEGRESLRFKGSSLLRLANIPAKRDGRRWAALRRDLNELNRIGLLGSYRWDSDPWTLAGICTLEPAQWLLDRTVRGIKPIELPPVAIPRTGAELRTWRTDRRLTQAEAAARLGIGRRTIARIEASPDDPVTQAVIKAFENGRGA